MTRRTAAMPTPASIAPGRPWCCSTDRAISVPSSEIASRLAALPSASPSRSVSRLGIARELLGERARRGHAARIRAERALVQTRARAPRPRGTRPRR